MGEDYLENVAAQTVGDAPADIRLVLLVRKRGGGGADGAEIVGGVVTVMDGLLYLYPVRWSRRAPASRGAASHS